MPEGDTVWRTASHLHRALSGHVLVESDLRVPGFATVDLVGRPVIETVARGKHLLTRIGNGDDAVTLHTHLKMEGSWHLYRKGTRWRRPAHQARAVLRTQDWTAVGFSLGVTELVARSDEPGVVGHLGPDLLGPDWDEDEALRRLRSAPDREVGEALLDQRNLAGIGNMYKAEICFLFGVNPWYPVRDVTELPRLLRRSKAVLELNKDRVEQTTTGDVRRGKQLWVYRRDRQPCRRCGTPISKAAQSERAEQERETYWCPTCQPGQPD